MATNIHRTTNDELNAEDLCSEISLLEKDVPTLTSIVPVVFQTTKYSSHAVWYDWNTRTETLAALSQRAKSPGTSTDEEAVVVPEFRHPQVVSAVHLLATEFEDRIRSTLFVRGGTAAQAFLDIAEADASTYETKNGFVNFALLDRLLWATSDTPERLVERSPSQYILSNPPEDAKMAEKVTQFHDAGTTNWIDTIRNLCLAYENYSKRHGLDKDMDVDTSTAASGLNVIESLRNGIASAGEMEHLAIVQGNIVRGALFLSALAMVRRIQLSLLSVSRTDACVP